MTNDQWMGAARGSDERWWLCSVIGHFLQMFATIYVPDFALQCVLRYEPDLRDCALAVVDGGLPARVRQVTPSAREQGVTTGMTTTQALGRCPALLFRTVGESLLAPAGSLLLQCAECFSPWLEVTGEGVVTLEWRGENEPQRLRDAEMAYDGERSAGHSEESPLGLHAPASLRLHAERARQIVARLAQCGLTAKVGVATTPDLALLAAHAAGPVRVVEEATEFLAPLPIEALAADGEISRSRAAAEELQAARAEGFRRLHRWGIHTLGAFAALQREQVVARLGGLAGEMWDRAAGGVERPLRLVRAPEIFAEAMELEHEVETLEPLLFILRRFLEQLATRLDAAYRVAAMLELRLLFRDGPPHARALQIPSPTSDVDVLFRVVSTHLEGVTAASPIIGLSLSAQPARPERQQFSLFESGLRDPNKFYETLARLHALLGNDRVGTPVAQDTHRPDAFHLETPRFDEALSSTATVSASVAGTAAAAPLSRFRPPLHADVQTVAGRPLRVFSEKAFGEVTDCRGPWLGSGDWWAERAWEREEWDVEVGGTCYRLACQGGAWFLDGAYD
jgi:protein ImuB